MKQQHLQYLMDRGVDPALVADRYFSDGDNLAIRYWDPEGRPYQDCKGGDYIVHRVSTGCPKFKAPACSGSRPYFSSFMPDGYLGDINIPLVLIEGPVKVDSCFHGIPTGYAFVGLTGTWNIVDHRGEDGVWRQENEKTRVLPELKAIPMNGRTVIVLFDSDIKTNGSVAKAAKFIGNWARKRGGHPLRVNLPSEPDGRKNGADDYLMRHSPGQLIERLQEAKVIGYHLPAPLLTEEGDIRHDLDPTEVEEAIAATAEISDMNLQEQVIRRLSRKLGRKFDDLLILVEEARIGEEDLGFLASDEDLEQSDIDSRWIVPDFIPRGEAVVLAADSGIGKTLLAYCLCRALIRGDRFLGFNVPKMRCLILQLEEGATCGSRLRALGFHQWSKRGEGWEVGQSFDLAKPRHRQQLQSLIRSGYDFVMVDPLRAIHSNAPEEISAEFGKKVVRPFVRLIQQAGATALIIHHNARHSGKYAGNGDIKAAVWGLFTLRTIENQPDTFHLSNLKEHDGKTRDGDPVLWRISRERVEGADGSQGDCQWTLEAMEQHHSPDLQLVERFEALLATQEQELTLRQIAELLNLPPDGTKVNASLRTMAAKTASIRRWRTEAKEGRRSATYFMPFDRRPASQQGLSTSGLLLNNQLTQKYLEGFSRDNLGETKGEPAPEVLTTGLTKTPLEASTYTPLPTLNGQTDAFWAIVDANPDAHPTQIANRLFAETGRNLTGAQVKALLQQQRSAA